MNRQTCFSGILAAAVLLAGPSVWARTLFVAGDDAAASRKKEPADSREMCLGGWTDALEPYLAKGVRLDNRAAPGLSPVEMRAGGVWRELCAKIRSGDIVFLAFAAGAHVVDGPDYLVGRLAECARDVRAAGGEAVVVTPPARRIAEEPAPIARRDRIRAAYAAAMRELAAREGLPLLDLHALSQALQKGMDAARTLPWYRAVEDGRDNDAITRLGAHVYAREMMRDLQQRDLAAGKCFRPMFRPAAVPAIPADAVRTACDAFGEAETAHFRVRRSVFAADYALAAGDGAALEKSRRLAFTVKPRTDAAGRVETGFFRVAFEGLADGCFRVYPRKADGTRGAAIVLAQNRVFETDTSKLAADLSPVSFEIEITPWNAPRVIALEPGATALPAALKQVADWRKTDVLTPVTLRLAAGDYPLAEGLRITRDHARAGWAPLALVGADPAKKPRLLGGTPVSGWTKTVFNGRSDVWQADVSALKLPARNKLLFFNGRKMEAARWPNLDAKRPYTTGFAFAVGKTEGKTRWQQRPVGMFEDEIPSAPTDRRAWSNPAEGWVIVFPRHNWWNRTYALTNVTAAGVLKLAAPHKEITDRLFIWDRWCVMGVREELDAPGEWYFDRAAGRVFFIPPNGEDPNAGIVTVARAPEILKLEAGTANVILESLEITGGNGGVTLERADDVAVRGCAIHDIGFLNGNGVTARGRRIEIADNDIWNIGGHGVSVNGPYQENGFTDRARSRVTNNYIHHVGQVNSHGIGVIMYGQGIEIHHNLIHDTPRCGLFGYGRFCDIAYNVVRHTNTINDDTGAIYGGGWTGGQGSVVRYNRFSHSIGFQRAQDGTYRLFKGACGIYPDEGCGGLTVYGNLVEHCHHVAMHLHNGRWITISNNVFVSNGALPVGKETAQLSLQTWNNRTNEYFVKVRQADIAKDFHKLIRDDHRWLSLPSLRQAPDRDDLCYNPNGTTMMGVQVRNNVIAYPDQGEGTMLRSWASLQLEANPFDNNLYWPGQTTNVVQRSGASLNWREWQARGQDVHSAIADPKFVDPARDDWRLRPDSPAFALGFKDLPYDRMGLMKTRLRREMPQEAEGLREHPEWLDVTGR